MNKQQYLKEKLELRLADKTKM